MSDNDKISGTMLAPPPMIVKKVIAVVSDIELARVVIKRRGVINPDFDSKVIKKIVGTRMNEIQGNRDSKGTHVTWKDLESLLLNTCKDFVESMGSPHEKTTKTAREEETL